MLEFAVRQVEGVGDWAPLPLASEVGGSLVGSLHMRSVPLNRSLGHHLVSEGTIWNVMVV